MSPSVRMSAEQRRELVLDAARDEFGERGYEATTTESIAKRVGVSQPYLFRLFPNKRAIFLASAEGCFDRVEEMFEEASAGLTGEAALTEMGRAYSALLGDRPILRMQLQMWATACHDVEVRDLARRRMARLWEAARRISGADDTRIMQFMAGGMLVNIMAAMDLPLIKDKLGEALTGLAGEPQA